MTQIAERIVGGSDIIDMTDISERVEKNMRRNNLPTGNQSESHASPEQAEPVNREKLAGPGWEEGREREEEQFIIANTSLATSRNSQEKKVQVAGTPLIPTGLSDFPSSPDVGSPTEQNSQAVRKHRKETTILDPTFLFSTQTSTFTAAMKSHFFKVATVEAETTNRPTEGNWNKLQYEIVTETSQSQDLVNEDMTEVILIRKCSYCGFINYSWLP